MESDDETKSTKLEDLGFTAFLASNRNVQNLDGFSVARIIAEHKEIYKIKNAGGECLAKITGKRIFNASSREDYPAVGDWVTITELGNQQAVIHGVLPRKTIIKRRSGDKNETQIIATNIDVALVVESVDRDYNLNRFERYFSIANDGGVESAIILNKIDMISKDELDLRMTQLRNRFKNIDIIPTSTIANEGLDVLKNYIKKGKTYCFIGSSGVGKSSLINELLDKASIETGDISFYSGRGKHVTTGREMYFLKNGGVVIDNPGMREVGMSDTGIGIDNLFDEITALAKKCKYIDCRHLHEPGCAVLTALRAGELDQEKYSNYIKLKKEAEYYEMSEFEKREKNRQFGKFVKKAKEGLKNNSLKD